MAEAAGAAGAAGVARGGVWAEVARDVIRVSGPDAGSYLQGQTSQDLTALAPGSHAWSWILAPAGRVDALVRVTRTGDEEWLVDTDPGWGEAVLARLQRFKLRTRADLEQVPARLVCWRPDTPAVGGGSPGLVVISPPWPGEPGADVLCLDGAEPPTPPASWVQATPEEWEARRIASGRPAMGSELDERTIPAESGLVGFTVSFTKGCYTGQELVARIDSRGSHVPRRLARLRSASPLTAGDHLLDREGREAVSLTSAAAGPDGAWVALGYLKRGYEPPLALQCPAGSVVEVVDLVDPLEPVGPPEPVGPVDPVDRVQPGAQ